MDRICTKLGRHINISCCITGTEFVVKWKWKTGNVHYEIISILLMLHKIFDKYFCFVAKKLIFN